MSQVNPTHLRITEMTAKRSKEEWIRMAVDKMNSAIYSLKTTINRIKEDDHYYEINDIIKELVDANESLIVARCQQTFEATIHSILEDVE